VTGQIPPPAPDLEAGKAQLPPITQLNPSIPLDKAESIAKAMALDPSQRFQSVEEFWQALTTQPKGPARVPNLGLRGLVVSGAFLSLAVFLPSLSFGVKPLLLQRENKVLLPLSPKYRLHRSLNLHLLTFLLLFLPPKRSNPLQLHQSREKK